VLAKGLSQAVLAVRHRLALRRLAFRLAFWVRKIAPSAPESGHRLAQRSDTLAALPESLRPLPNLATLSMRKARFEVPWRCPPLVRSACHCNVHNLLRVHVDHEDGVQRSQREALLGCGTGPRRNRSPTKRVGGPLGSPSQPSPGRAGQQPEDGLEGR